MLSWIALWCQSVSVELTFWYLPLVLFPSREIGNDIYGIYVVVRNDIDRVVRPPARKCATLATHFVELRDVWISSAGLRFLGEEMAAKLI